VYDEEGGKKTSEKVDKERKRKDGRKISGLRISPKKMKSTPKKNHEEGGEK